MATKVLQPGKDVPHFTVDNQDGDPVTPDDFKSKWIVLYFYPKDNTPGCTVEAVDFTRLQDEFVKANTSIFGVSKDSCESHQKFIEKRELTIQLLADTEKVLYEAFRVSSRTTFLIDAAGKIAKVWENVKAKGHAEEVLATLQNLQALAAF